MERTHDSLTPQSSAFAGRSYWLSADASPRRAEQIGKQGVALLLVALVDVVDRADHERGAGLGLEWRTSGFHHAAFARHDLPGCITRGNRSGVLIVRKRASRAQGGPGFCVHNPRGHAKVARLVGQRCPRCGFTIGLFGVCRGIRGMRSLRRPSGAPGAGARGTLATSFGRRSPASLGGPGTGCRTAQMLGTRAIEDSIYHPSLGSVCYMERCPG